MIEEPTEAFPSHNRPSWLWSIKGHRAAIPQCLVWAFVVIMFEVRREQLQELCRLGDQHL